MNEAQLDEYAAIQAAIDSGNPLRVRAWAQTMAKKDDMEAAMELLETASVMEHTNIEIQRIKSGDYDDTELDEARDNELSL